MALDYAHQHGYSVSSSLEPLVVITINPEARVSANFNGPLPTPVTCGKPTVLSVRILNCGSVNSQLEAALVENVPEGVTLQFRAAPLTGAPAELRQLKIVLNRRSLADVTIAFRSHSEAPDIGGRNRIHFLMRCL